MSVSLQLVQNMTLTDTGVNQSFNPGVTASTPSSSQFSQEAYSVPTTSGGVAIPLGSITTPGYFVIKNLDSANYITLLTAVSGTPFCRVKPGETSGPFFFDATITAPAWIAHTAICKATFMLTDGA